MSANKTIAKNTLFLYFRMFLVMGVTLYTSRVVLEQLGVSDYGLYSLVGGIVSMFAFFNSAMSTATQRYLTYDLGKNDEIRLQHTFGVTLTIHIGIAIVILILAETVGLWYVNYKVVLPVNRLFAANVVYQFSVAASLVGVIQIPYDALIIAYERMNIYAYVSILEVSLKLGAVFLLILYKGDKLILYAILVFLISVIIRVIYQVYCRRHFKASKYIFKYDKNYYRELISYSGWNLFGSVATLARSQGLNVVLNLFYGTVVNAAYGLALQVQGAVNLFVNSFMKAVNPQVIKSFSANDVKRTHQLIFKSSRFSFFLMLLLVVPLICNAEMLLGMWLKNPPQYTVLFVQLSLVGILIDCISYPLMTGAQATGKIKWYQIVVGSIIMLNVPISYIWFHYQTKPEIVFYVIIGLNTTCLVFRLLFLRRILSLNIFNFFKEVLLRIVMVVLVLSIVLIYMSQSEYHIMNSWIGLFSTFLLTCLSILFLGISRKELIYFKDMIINKKIT